MILDHIGDQIGETSLSDKQAYYATQFEVHVGNSLIWYENEKCGGGPFLASNFEDYHDTVSWYSFDGMAPAYGFEAACNLPGRYTFIVASGVPSTQVRLCSLGVTGNVYSRQQTLETQIEIEEGAVLEFLVDHISAERALGNTIVPNVRQNRDAEMSCITLERGTTATIVRVDAGYLTAG